MDAEQNSAATTLTLPRRATIEGAINFPGPVVIDGTLIGEVRSASVVISERGIVEGSIWAGSVTVLGEVTGDIYAVTLILKTACSVHGNIFHRHLSLENGCYFEGKSRRHNEPLALGSA
ncbi:MAG: polymer-forming cytoskeletal protein [Hyphomicrobiaceae bacterium]